MLGLCAYLFATAWWLGGRVDRVGHELTAVIAVAMTAPEPPPDPNDGLRFIEYGG
jgi:hypothetical protein